MDVNLISRNQPQKSLDDELMALFLQKSSELIMVTKLLLVYYITTGIMHYTIETKRFVTRGLLHQTIISLSMQKLVTLLHNQCF